MSMGAAEYCFVVEDAKGASFELDIMPSDHRAKQHFQSVWQRLSMAVEGMKQDRDSGRTRLGRLAAVEMVRRQARGVSTAAEIRGVVWE